ARRARARCAAGPLPERCRASEPSRAVVGASTCGDYRINIIAAATETAKNRRGMPMLEVLARFCCFPALSRSSLCSRWKPPSTLTSDKQCTSKANTTGLLLLASDTKAWPQKRPVAQRALERGDFKKVPYAVKALLRE